MKKLKQFFLAATLVFSVACGGVEGDYAEEPGLEIETHQSAIIDQEPWIREEVDQCVNEGQACHLYSGVGDARRCYSGKVICVSGSIPYCDALSTSTTYELGRCPRRIQTEIPIH